MFRYIYDQSPPQISHAYNGFNIPLVIVLKTESERTFRTATMLSFLMLQNYLFAYFSKIYYCILFQDRKLISSPTSYFRVSIMLLLLGVGH
jgi:hypothetical protein